MSKRIQKHLIYRDDTMAFDNGDARFYVDTLNNDDGLIFAITAWNGYKSETEYIYSPSHINQSEESIRQLANRMRDISGDLRKWRVIKNGN